MKSFKENIFYKNPKKIKLVQFWSTWCGACIEVDHLRSFHKKHPSVEVYRLNVEENQPYSLKYSIVILPTYIFFKNLKPILILTGKQTFEVLDLFFKAKLAKS